VPNCLSVLIDGAKEPHNNPFSAPLERKITGSKINDNLLAFSYDCRCGKRSFFEFSLCLSRAGLGKMIVFIYKWLKKAVFCRVSEAQKQKNAARLEEAKAFRAVDPKTNGWTGKALPVVETNGWTGL